MGLQVNKGYWWVPSPTLQNGLLHALRVRLDYSRLHGRADILAKSKAQCTHPCLRWLMQQNVYEDSGHIYVLPYRSHCVMRDRRPSHGCPPEYAFESWLAIRYLMLGKNGCPHWDLKPRKVHPGAVFEDWSLKLAPEPPAAVGPLRVAWETWRHIPSSWPISTGPVPCSKGNSGLADIERWYQNAEDSNVPCEISILGHSWNV